MQHSNSTLLQITLHIKLIQNIGYIPCVVQHILAACILHLVDLQPKFKWCPFKVKALRSIALPSPTVDSDANRENQSQGQERCQDDQPFWWEAKDTHELGECTYKLTRSKQELQSTLHMGPTKGLANSQLIVEEPFCYRFLSNRTVYHTLWPVKISKFPQEKRISKKHSMNCKTCRCLWCAITK